MSCRSLQPGRREAIRRLDGAGIARAPYAYPSIYEETVAGRLPATL